MASDRERLSEGIAARIRERILSGRLAPGARLPAERELAQRDGVSRVSVREAYRSLEAAGLIVIRRGAEGGAFVADSHHEPVARSLEHMLRLGKASLEELTEVRLVIEPPVAALAARRATDRDLDAIGAMLWAQARAVRGDEDPSPYDLRFHRLIAEASGNVPLRIVMHAIADLTMDTIARLHVGRDARRHVVRFHEQIFDAIRARDEEAAADLMRRHVVDIQARLQRAGARSRRRTPRRSR